MQGLLCGGLYIYDYRHLPPLIRGALPASFPLVWKERDGERKGRGDRAAPMLSVSQIQFPASFDVSRKTILTSRSNRKREGTDKSD
jgi:hypothetical protein